MKRTIMLLTIMLALILMPTFCFAQTSPDQPPPSYPPPSQQQGPPVPSYESCMSVCANNGSDSYVCYACFQNAMEYEYDYSGITAAGSFFGGNFGMIPFAAIWAATMYYDAVQKFYEQRAKDLEECYAAHPKVVRGSADDPCKAIMDDIPTPGSYPPPIW